MLRLKQEAARIRREAFLDLQVARAVNQKLEQDRKTAKALGKEINPERRGADEAYCWEQYREAVLAQTRLKALTQ